MWMGLHSQGRYGGPVAGKKSSAGREVPTVKISTDFDRFLGASPL